MERRSHYDSEERRTKKRRVIARAKRKEKRDKRRTQNGRMPDAAKDLYSPRVTHVCTVNLPLSDRVASEKNGLAHTKVSDYSCKKKIGALLFLAQAIVRMDG